jgi:ubiquinone/menaquinone biosynthesis C-methylase UbiE
MNEIENSWDQKATQWKKLVGDKGDNNRIYNSDPVLWKFVGNPKGLNVLDAGCGTGYLSIQLAEIAASVVGIDLSGNMIKEAKTLAEEKNSNVDFRVDSCMELKTIADNSMDMVVSNYVLMDLPDLASAVKNFYRVLKNGGKAVLVFSHPYSSGLTESENYFDEIKKIDRWGEFDSDFIFFHRPLSQYWQSFRQAGFIVEDFDEPVAKDPNAPGFKQEWTKKYRKTPWSVAFLLRK